MRAQPPTAPLAPIKKTKCFLLVGTHILFPPSRILQLHSPSVCSSFRPNHVVNTETKANGVACDDGLGLKL